MNPGIFRWTLACLLGWLLIALLVGCASKPKTPEAPPASAPVVIKAPEVPKETVADKYADHQDKANDYAAAAVTTAREALASNKPKVADRELEVAQANLPRPSNPALISARKRAGEGKDETYAAHLARADGLQKKVDEAWAAVEREKARNDALELELKANLAKQKADAEARQKADADRKRQERLDELAARCNWLGGILIAAGLLCFALSSYLPIHKATAPVAFMAGTFIVGVPYALESILDWPYFQPVMVGTFVLIVLAIAAFWFMAHRNNGKAETGRTEGA